MDIPNLDLMAAACGQQIIADEQSKDSKALDRTVTKALGVLQEDGVYAALLFLSSYKEQANMAKAIRKHLLLLAKDDMGILANDFPAESATWGPISQALTQDPGPLANLDTVFLLKSVFEQALIYARYGAKAATFDGDAKGQQQGQGQNQ